MRGTNPVTPAGLGDNPLVSVIIPSRDRPAVVAAAVRSVLAQSYQNLEIVLVDDGSALPLTPPPDAARDPRLSLVRLEASVGPGEARNIGARRSSGPLLAFLDDDDTWRPAKIARQVDELTRSGPRVAACETGFDLWEAGRLVMRFVPRSDRDLPRVLLERPCLQPSTVLLRRSVFDALDGFDPTLRRIEDWDLWVRLADSFDTVAICEVLVDRETSHPSPSEMLRWSRAMVTRLAPRIDALPQKERARVLATHALTDGLLLAAAGRSRKACATILSAWRLRPIAWRPAAYLVRVVVGERAWTLAKRCVRLISAPLARALGRDPLLRSW